MTANWRKFKRCRCYLTRNYYVHEYDVHLQYFENDEQFLTESAVTLEKRGCNTDEKLRDVLDLIKLEYNRRRGLDLESMKRQLKIKAEYVPLHEEIYTLKRDYLDNKFLEAVEHAKSPKVSFTTLQELLKLKKPHRVYRFPVFTTAFCKLLLEEIDHFERSEMPKERPNTMNKSGILLGEIGFDEGFVTPFREHYLGPLARVLYPEWCGTALDSHRAFTVKYKEDEDTSLGFHFDNAEVTLNISLGKDFEDGSLYFGSMRQEQTRVCHTTEVQHCIGEGLLHRGQHKHGAMPISFGERINLIIWMRSSAIRNKLCPMCDNVPILMPATGFGDGFTDIVTEEVQLCNLN